MEDQLKTHDQLLGEVMRLRRRVDELEKTLTRNRQEERLGAVRAAASGIAHDFNNTISAILGWSELLLIRPEILDDRDKTARHLQTIKTAALDAASVVRRLRRFYRRRGENEPFESVPLNDLVEQAILLTQPKWQDDEAGRESIQVLTDLQTIPAVSGNESELREMLTNLIHNSVEAMSGGGTITIRSSHEETDGKPMVVVEVEDTGSGMTEQTLDRCLEPFFSTKGERGTGLGLPMVYGIVGRHEGTIEIDSRLMAGTIVTVRIPPQTEQTAGVRTEQESSRPGSLRVLIVEDDPAVCEVLIAYLSNDGHSYEAAHDGGEGLEKFYAGRFDVVLTDQVMPGMTGEQLARAVKRVAPTKPVILLTAVAGSVRGPAGEQPQGVDYVVDKPITLTEFRAALARVT